MKRIVIIGAGISGLAVLHYLKRRLGHSVEITLFEREAWAGGTIRSFQKESALFEWGPNGFLDNQPATLQLIEELGLSDQLIGARAALPRYIQINGRLRAVPSGPVEFLTTPLLPFKDKWSLVKGVFKKNISKDCSIYDYVARRFSANMAESLADPMISGIYAGNIKRLHMASAFPKLGQKGLKRHRLFSFKKGMGQIIEALVRLHLKNIKTNDEISSLPKADIIVIATPAYAASRIVEHVNPSLAQLLDQLPYAPVAVAGMLFKMDAFKVRPDGFGYLIPSRENKDVLGVLIESNVYTHRAGNDQVMVRVMLGGAHHPAIINDSQEQILAKALKEIDSTYGLVGNPLETFVKSWPKAIPQYEMNYPHLRQSIAQECAKIPGLYLCANYLDGISFNDCITNAKSVVPI